MAPPEDRDHATGPRRSDQSLGPADVERRLDARLTPAGSSPGRSRRGLIGCAVVGGLLVAGALFAFMQVGPTPAAPPSSVVRPVTLAFGGDVHAEGGSGQALREGLPSVRDVLGRADVTVLNLETAVTGGGTRADKEFAYRAPASVLTQLKDAGVDLVTLANNHGMDFGREGLRDTLEASEATGLPVVGIGFDEDQAYAPRVIEVRGQRIAVLGATQVLDSELEAAWTAGPGTPGLASAKREARLLQEVTRARKRVDTVVVYLHWGRELDSCPLPRQQALARQLVAAGADVVVGSHAHVLLGGGWLDKAYVDYGLGNFAFGARREETARTGVLTLTVSGREVTGAEWTPAQIRSGAPVLLTGEPARKAVADKDRRRDCTGLSATAGGGGG